MDGDKDDNIVVVGGKPLDISKAFPMTLGDSVDLEEAGIDIGTPQNRPSAIMKIMKVLFKKIDPAITEADIRSITGDQLARFTEVFTRMAQLDREAKPTSIPS